MVLITESGPETLPIGSPAPDFDLPSTGGETLSLASFGDAREIVLAFTCNHCPYARAYDERFMKLAADYASKGVSFAAINPNNAESHPADSFEKMVERAEELGISYPYLRDESQEVAAAYGAVCTPHYFILDADRKVAYEGRIDGSWQEPDKVDREDLREALEDLLAGRPVQIANTNPMGCSIKWKG